MILMYFLIRNKNYFKNIGLSKIKYFSKIFWSFASKKYLKLHVLQELVEKLKILNLFLQINYFFYRCNN